jgi:hypothetical protein
MFSGDSRAEPIERCGIALERQAGTMSESSKTTKLSWPWWSPWVLAAVVATSILTVAATLYDIL